MDYCIKGHNCIVVKKFIEQSFGQDGLAKVFARTGKETREALERTILSSSWQQEKYFLELLRATQELFGNDTPDLVFKIGRYCAHNSIATIYKIFLRFGNPGFIIARAGRVWTQIHNHGHLDVVQNNDTSSVGRLYDYKTPDKLFCQYLLGYLSSALELSGAKNISLKETACVNQGAAYCEYTATWTL